jgi:hypothetical protein
VTEIVTFWTKNRHSMKSIEQKWLVQGIGWADSPVEFRR